jgi:hypothetical protein
MASPQITKSLLNMLSIYSLQVLSIRNAGLDIAGHAHRRVPVEFNLFTSEEMINLLQGEVTRFRVEVVDEREEAEVEN